MSVSVNRATPSKQEILEVFGNRVDENTLILCDGAKSYDVLEQKCTVANTRNINKVNGLHSLIKHKIRNARGFATIYLNRYNALFSKIYANVDKAVDEIFFLMTESNKFYSIEHTKFNNLLKI